MRILIVNGNPDAALERLTSGLARAYADGAQSAGHKTRMIDVGALSFSLLRSAAGFQVPPKDPDIISAQESFQWAEHLVFVYPIWLGGVPAVFKGFMELVGAGGFLTRIGPGGHSKGNMSGRSARIIVTMGMPAFLYRFFYSAHGAKAFKRSVLQLAGIYPIRTTYIGNVRPSPKRNRQRIDPVRRLGLEAQ